METVIWFPLPLEHKEAQPGQVKLTFYLRLIWVGIFFGSLSLSPVLRGATPVTPETPPVFAAAATHELPGIAAAEAVSQVTGMAISPALGVASVGAWKYFHTPVNLRVNLPWWSQPWFWGPALAMVLLVFLKDAAGPLLPKALKKPLDAAELFENKFSALLATGAIIPLVWSVLRSLNGPGRTGGGSAYGGLGIAALDFSAVWDALGIPVALVAFGAVFLVSHVIQVLILLSPFAVVDAFLKTTRLFLLATVAGTSLANPYLGAGWSLVIILVSLPLAGWAFRWLVFGQVFAWDFITFHRHRRLPTVTDNRAFLSQTLAKSPRRSYGRLARNEAGDLVFKYRPWGVFAARYVTLPKGRYAVGRGLFYPELLRLDAPSGKSNEPTVVEVLDFPPRAAGHENLIAQTYGITEIRDVGLRAIWRWLRDKLPKASLGGDAGVPAIRTERT